MKKPLPPIRYCPYCQVQLEFSHLESTNEWGRFSVYECLHCPVLVWLHYENDSLIKSMFFIDKNEHNYVWVDHYLKNQSYLIDATPSFKGPYDKDPMLIKFPKLMNVTPTNVREKFSFFMVFI
jgi:hypothetical protein